MKCRLKYWEDNANAEFVLHETFMVLLGHCFFTSTCISKNAPYVHEDTTKDGVVCQTFHKPKIGLKY